MDDLVLGHVGETIAGRYTLVSIGDDAVELRDSGEQRIAHRRLP